MESLNLFKASKSKENIALIILQEIEDLLNVSFTHNASSEELIQHEEKISFSNSNEEQLRTGLSALAKFHAASVAHINSKSKMNNLSEIEILREDPFCQNNWVKIYSSVVKLFMDMKVRYPHTFLDDISVQDIEKEFIKITEKLKKIDDCTKTLINGNYSHYNLIFNKMNNDCLIKDFSYVAYESPLFDVFHYVSSISSISNWEVNTKNAEVLYYNFLHNEMKKFKIEIITAFPKEEYEETYKLMVPIMKIIFLIGKIHKKTFVQLAETMSILNLNPLQGNHSVISFEDCYLVFEKLKVEKFPLNAFSTKPQTGRNGFLGEHHDMIIEVGKYEKIVKKFFVKAIPHCKALQDFAKTVGSFFKETMFYSRYIPLLKENGIFVLDKVVPECYFADEYKYIILDNLKTYKYTTISPRLEMSHEVTSGVIKILAKLNASCIILEELIERKTGYKYRLLDDFEKELKEAFYSSEPVIEAHRNSGKGGMTALVEIVHFNDEIDHSTFKKLAEEACDEQVNFAKPSEKWRNTLCHGDFWTKNFMIKFEENKVKDVMMIDFQTYRYGPPAQDLMAFIYLNTTRKTRQEHMKNWLDYYYKVFSENLQDYSIDVNNILPRKDFDESCMFYKKFAITQSITHFQIILVPPEIIDPLLENNERLHNIFFGSRYDLVKSVWQMDEVYRTKLTENLVELRRCLVDKSKIYV